jgi:putative inorganic carbon (hco3(-)) transporter
VNRTYKNILVIALGLLLSLASSLLVVNSSGILGIIIIIAVGALFLAGFVIYDFTIGVYFLFILGTFMFYLDRIVTVPIPLGIVYDALVVLTFIAIFLNTKKNKEWNGFSNSLTIIFIVITVYQLLQFFNPNAVSKTGWLVSIRNNTSFLLYIIFFQAFITLRDFKRFTYFWLAIALLIAFYGFYQEIFGLTEFEWKWMYRVPDRIKLYFIWGRMRKFSFLSDPSAYGLFTAFAALAFLALLFGPYKFSRKIIYGICLVIMLIAMSYSGTRTAIAMVAIGAVFLLILNINNFKAMVISVSMLFFSAIILFGPFYGGTVNRIRSTFNVSEDASMSVRDNKRITRRSYVLSHPIGGGLFTTGANGFRYSRGHPLAQQSDPDSGYLLTALEMGWIGLIIFMIFFSMVTLIGINRYFEIKNAELKNWILVYIVPFFALSVAHFTQDAMFQKPVSLIVIAAYAMVIKVPLMENDLKS